ncbi:MAG TPA: hypothetical protein VIP53_03550 [Nitrososphaera sp.]|jgi:hypothetical protein
MHRINKKNNSHVIAAASVATLLTFAIVAAAVSNIANTIIPASATTTTTTTTSNDTTTTTSPSEIDLSPEPVYQEQQTLVSENPINQTHTQFTFSGNGTLNLPNGTEPISITSTGSVIAAMDGTAVGEEVLTTEDGTESAIAKFYSIGRFNMEDGSGKSILIALVHTNSTGQLAPLNGAIVAGEVEFLPVGTSLITLWEWQSGIPLPTSTGTTTAMEAPPQTNTTTMTTTNATTTAIADTNATTSTAPEEQGEGEQQQCQLEIRTNGDTFGLGESVTITVTNGGDEALEFSNSILGLEIENQDTGEAYPLYSAQAIITLEPGESRTSELSYEVLVSEIGTGLIEASVSSDEGCLASTTFTLA